MTKSKALGGNGAPQKAAESLSGCRPEPGDDPSRAARCQAHGAWGQHEVGTLRFWDLRSELNRWSAEIGGEIHEASLKVNELRHGLGGF